MIYIAGPMTGIPDYNYPEFRLAALTLRGLGFEVINPAEEFNGDQDLSRSVYMRQAVGNLLTASALYLLPGWENSPGACLEVAIAAELDLPFMMHFGAIAPDGAPDISFQGIPV